MEKEELKDKLEEMDNSKTIMDFEGLIPFISSNKRRQQTLKPNWGDASPREQACFPSANHHTTTVC